jgi:hypothetical protein
MILLISASGIARIIDGTKKDFIKTLSELVQVLQPPT